jgi:peptidoglycan pentaglycine glycine transferase (the first glycine)
MDKEDLNFLEKNSPDGGFLQSEYWRKFQEIWGRKAHNILINDNGKPVASASVITHTLPLIGDYFYTPRGPVIGKFQILIFINKLIGLAKQNNISWVRIEPNSEQDLKSIKENLPAGVKIKKSPVDVQPREILILDITKSGEEILAEMKQKTRYNVKLSQKRGVSVKVITNYQLPITKKYVEDFLKLVKITSVRDKIKSHPEDYYRKIFEAISGEVLKLYVAEYEGRIIAANLVIFFGKTVTYMHGASDNDYRNVMAPYLLQWRQILDAKGAGCEKYDFGGVKSGNAGGKSWEGITKFKTGFAPNTGSIEFPGCHDIVLKPGKYSLYRILRKVKP